MTTGHVFIATSLDGFIARKDHALDWFSLRGKVSKCKRASEVHGFYSLEALEERKHLKEVLKSPKNEYR